MFDFGICSISPRVARDDSLEKVTFESTLEGTEEAKGATVWGKNILGGGTGQ